MSEFPDPPPVVRQPNFRAALIAAVKVIKRWHNIAGFFQPGTEKPCAQDAYARDAWRIYWRSSPEMAPIREALPGVNLDEPEKL